MNKPVLLVVDDDPQVLAAVRRDLRSRYRDSTRSSAPTRDRRRSTTARELKSRGDALAMVISDQRMPGMLGGELLASSREVYPLARRVLLTAYSDIDAAIRAINEAHLDHYLSKPWDPPEERLFPVVDDLLDAWQAESLPEATGLRLVGHQWATRSHAIKDFLAGNLIPYRWLDVERDAEARTLLEAAGVGADALPALFFEDGSVLTNPEPRQVAERLGRPLSAALELYDLVIVGAGPAGLAAAVYGASEGLRTLLLDRHAPGRTGGDELAHRKLPRVPDRRQRQRADAPRHRAGAASRRRVPRTARGHRGVDRRRLQAPRARRRTRAGHANHARRDGHDLSRASGAGRGGAHRRRRLLRRRDHRSAGVPRPARSRRRRRELRRPGRDAPGAVTPRSADRGAPRGPPGDDVAVPDRADRQDANIRVRPRTEIAGVDGEGHVERVVLSVARRRIVPDEETPTPSSSSSGRGRAATGCRPKCCATRRGSSSRAAT